MKTQRWNDDKKHRCPACHAIAVPEGPGSFSTYTCCRCGVGFARWPWLAWVLRRRGVVCPESHGAGPATVGAP